MRYQAYIQYFIVGTILIASLQGCATNLRSMLSEAEVQIAGGALQAFVNSNSPPGKYTLETTGGTPISHGTFSPPQRTTWVSGKYPVNFQVDVRRLDQNIAKSCMRIRRPDGKLLAIGFLKQTDFTVPAFEVQWLQYVEVPRIRGILSALDRYRYTAESAERWLSAHPNVYGNGKCRFPDTGPPPASACRSEREAEARFSDQCIASNIGCSLVGAGVDVTVAGILNESNISTLAAHLATSSCSLQYDRLHGQRSDPTAYILSIGITWLTELTYKSLINDKPKGYEKFVIAAIAGAFNYQLCMNNAISRCLRIYQRWQAPSRRLFEQCTTLNAQRQSSRRLLDQYGNSRDRLEQQIQDDEQRIRSLATGGVLQRRGAALRTVDGC